MLQCCDNCDDVRTCTCMYMYVHVHDVLYPFRLQIASNDSGSSMVSSCTSTSIWRWPRYNTWWCTTRSTSITASTTVSRCLFHPTVTPDTSPVMTVVASTSKRTYWCRWSSVPVWKENPRSLRYRRVRIQQGVHTATLSIAVVNELLRTLPLHACLR